MMYSESAQLVTLHICHQACQDATILYSIIRVQTHNAQDPRTTTL